MRVISDVRSKSQRKIRFFIVPVEVIRITMAVRRLVCTNWTPRTTAPLPEGVVETAANRVSPASARETFSSRRSGS